MQFAGSELPNGLRHSGAAARDALRNRDFERDGEPDLHGSLLFEPTCVSDELRPAVSFAVNNYPLPTVAWVRRLMVSAS